MRLSSSRNRTDRATIFAAPAKVEARISNDRFSSTPHPIVSIDSSAAPMRPAKGQIAWFSLQVFVGDERRPRRALSSKRAVRARSEMVRQLMFAQYGDQTYSRGLNVYTSINAADQNAAYDALRRGILDFGRPKA